MADRYAKKPVVTRFVKKPTYAGREVKRTTVVRRNLPKKRNLRKLRPMRKGR